MSTGKTIALIKGIGGGSGSGGGASLPTAAPYQQLVTDGEGKWVAEDRLAWKTLQKGSELIPETNLSFTAQSGLMAGDAPLDTLLVAGEKYVVNWDGKEYVSTCQTASEGFPILGNYSLYDPAMDNTGEPFCAVQLFTLIFYTQDEAATHTVGLSAMSEAVRTVPAEYLPGYFKLFVVTAANGGDFENDTYTANMTRDEAMAVLQNYPFAVMKAGNKIYWLSIVLIQNDMFIMTFYDRSGDIEVTLMYNADGTIVFFNP